MLKFLKTTVVEDAIITEEVLVVLAEDAQVVTEVQLQEEKETLLQDVKVLVVDLEATEVQLLEKVVLAEEANLEVQLLPELADFPKELQDHQKLQDAMVVRQKDQLDARKVLVTHQEKKDLEEVKSLPLAPLLQRGVL